MNEPVSPPHSTEDVPAPVQSQVQTQLKDDKGRLHCENGPAVTFKDGSVEYWKHGQLHREGGPALIYKDGTVSYYRDGKMHREDGPAVTTPTSETWFRDGEMHRVGGPAHTSKDGAEWWYLNGKPHRRDGPAVKEPDGSVHYYLRGQLHRRGGPAAVWPAMEGREAHEEWWVNGEMVAAPSRPALRTLPTPSPTQAHNLGSEPSR